MSQGPTTEKLMTRVHRVLEGGDFLEIQLQASPVRYRLDKHRRDLRAHLEDAMKARRTVEVLVDWECQEVLEVSG